MSCSTAPSAPWFPWFASAALLLLFMSPCRAGLNRYTELDRVSGWRIERKQGADGALSCRAFLPSGASWFSGNIHLDLNGELVVPSGRSFKGGQQELEAVRDALQRCSRDVLYLPL